jgi:hypothetical protein
MSIKMRVFRFHKNKLIYREFIGKKHYLDFDHKSIFRKYRHKKSKIDKNKNFFLY